MNPEFEKWAQKKVLEVHNGSALENDCLRSLDVYCANQLWVKELAVQLYHIVLGFPFHIAGAVASARDENLLTILVRNLYAEIGSDKGNDHISVYREFLKYLQTDTARPNKEVLWSETLHLDECCEQYYAYKNMGLKLGSLFAFECMSSPMVEKWHNALGCNGYPSSAFRFFTIHIDIEKEHVDDILQVCGDYWGKDSFNDDFDRGQHVVVDSLTKFWKRSEAYYQQCN